jgi:hypothetical protein
VSSLEQQLREAVALAMAGDWQGAHEIVQELDEDPIANWIHAAVHRMEGDLDNARYWYRRSRQPAGERLSIEEELQQIAAALKTGG